MNLYKRIFLQGKRPYYWIIGLGFLVYFRSLFFKFSYLDDNVLILANLFFLKNPANIFKAFTTQVFHILHSSAAYYRPMLTVSFMIDSWFGGSRPFFYHLTNVIIHLIASSLVYLFFRKLKYEKILAFIFALVFTVHPVLAQAVSWIPGRNDSLLTVFFLSSFIYLIKYIDEGKKAYGNLHLLFFFFALFTKESAVFLPLIALFFLFFIRRENLKLTKYIKVYVGWFLIVTAWFFLRTIAVSSAPVHYEIKSIIETVFKNSPAVILYLGKVIFPINLSVLPTLQDSSLVYGFMAVAVILILIIFSKRKHLRCMFFGLLWFFLFLLPSFIRPSSEYVPDFLEHRVYMPLIGLFIVFMETSFVRKIGKNKIYISLAFILISIMSIFTIIHTGIFRNRVSFWENAVKNSPSHPLAHKNLGAMYYLDNNLEKAEVEFKKSSDINPSEPMIHNNLGLIYFRRKEYDQAEDEFKKELEINPLYDNAYFNWGLLYWEKGEKEEASQMWLKTIKINPDHKGALKNLALYYFQIKDQRAAEYYYREAAKRGVVF